MVADDTGLKVAIAERALPLFEKAGIVATKLEILMDIEFVNEVCPLDLPGLLNAGPGDFSHDIGGIYKHFNRATKQLEDCFVPRYARP